jgi:nicotinamidase-related amidase
MDTQAKYIQNAALLVIDIQEELFSKSTPVYHADLLLENICMLIERARQAGAPVVLIQHQNESFLKEGSEGWQLYHLLPQTTDDLHIHKLHGSAFEKTGLTKELEIRGIKTVVATGLVSHGCVQATCLDARKLGYQVILASDGHSNFNKQAVKVIDDCHKKLEAANIKLLKSQEIDFSPS